MTAPPTSDDPRDVAHFLATGMVRPDLVELFIRLGAGDDTVIRELQPLIDRVDESLVWDSTEFDAPDVPHVLHGREGVIEFFRRWLPAWERFEWTVSDFDVHGADVIYDVHINALSRETQMPLEMHVTHRMTVRDGKLVAWRFFRERSAALRSLG